MKNPRSFDTKDLDPGIAKTVAWLCENGFDTMDSGDGVSKPGAGEVSDGGIVEMQAFPHVAMVVPPRELATEADRLARLLGERGVKLWPFGRGADLPADGTMVEFRAGPTVTASYDPVDGVALLLLVHVDDALLGGC